MPKENELTLGGGVLQALYHHEHIKITKSLDSQFRLNYENDPSIKYVSSFRFFFSSLLFSSFFPLLYSNRFQYVATTSGVLRHFPGAEWSLRDNGAFSKSQLGSLVENVENTEVTQDSKYAAFDPRLTPWFSSTVSGPKNVILLLDTSQSSCGC